MSRLFIFIALASHILLASAQDSRAELGVLAIGLVVSDIEASEKFYTEIMGMVPAGSFDLSTEWSKDAGAANDRPFSVKMFKTVDQNTATVLKLAYFDDVPSRPQQKGVDSYAGVNYLTFRYNDLNDITQRIKKAGIEILGWVSQPTYQLFFIRDPDGVFVELIGPPKSK